MKVGIKSGQKLTLLSLCLLARVWRLSRLSAADSPQEDDLPPPCDPLAHARGPLAVGRPPPGEHWLGAVSVCGVKCKNVRGALSQRARHAEERTERGDIEDIEMPAANPLKQRRRQTNQLGEIEKERKQHKQKASPDAPQLCILLLTVLARSVKFAPGNRKGE